MARNLLSFSLVLAGMLAGSSLAIAASLTVDVTDAHGTPLADAVIFAEPVAGQLLPKALHAAEIEQRKRKFNPLVTVVQVGTEINFPNNDTVKHHVYSFSQAKVFDLPLYSGKPATPQLFDKPGTVVLGCNIHDQMLAYVEVVNTPYFGKTDATGKVKLDGIAPGKYALKAWHYNLPISAQVVEQPITMIGSDSAASFKLDLKPGATAK
ncbi:MAG TPA: methylamine utilization protein [Burkholderiaceae bacterium]|jgi:plastocyanin